MFDHQLRFLVIYAYINDVNSSNHMYKCRNKANEYHCPSAVADNS